jgi:hypothetical protein
MTGDLPPKTYQRKKLYRPTEYEVKTAYRLLNRYVFNDQLSRPEIEVKSHLRGCWGCCHWLPAQKYYGSWCRIMLSDKYFCEQWFYTVLAHEMVHQWQWDIHWHELDLIGKQLPVSSGAHGPSFYSWRDRFAEHGLSLKIAHGQKRWFRHQDFSRC